MASSLIGIVYLAPLSLLFYVKTKFWPSKKGIKIASLFSFGSFLAIALAEASESTFLMMATTSTLVIATTVLSSLVAVEAVARVHKSFLKHFP